MIPAGENAHLRSRRLMLGGRVTFREKLREISLCNRSSVCIGLDPDPARLPAHLGSGPEAVVAFNQAIIDATSDIVCAYKPNLGFYVGYGARGIDALVETRRMIPREIPAVLDAKVGDIDVTARGYARGYFEEWDFDAITAHPYLGEDSLIPFFEYRGRCVFVLVKTSNPGSGDLQDVPVAEAGETEPLYRRVARRVAVWQERYGTCGIVAGATYPSEIAAVREICPDVPLLAPGVGSQAGDLEAAVRAAHGPDPAMLLVNASRSIIYASSGRDFADAARTEALALRDRINAARATPTA
jgi:orotidine-5'-phosphate decarboxylase